MNHSKNILKKYDNGFLNSLRSTLALKIKNTSKSNHLASLEKYEIMQTRNNRKKLYEKHGIDPNKKPAIALKNETESIDFNAIKACMEARIKPKAPQRVVTNKKLRIPILPTKYIKKTYEKKEGKETNVSEQLNDISRQLLNITNQLEELKKHCIDEPETEIDVDWYYHYYNNDNWYYYYNRLIEFIRENKRYPTTDGTRTEKIIFKWYSLQKMLRDKLTPQKIALLNRVNTCIKIDL